VIQLKEGRNESVPYERSERGPHVHRRRSSRTDSHCRSCGFTRSALTECVRRFARHELLAARTERASVVILRSDQSRATLHQRDFPSAHCQPREQLRVNQRSSPKSIVWVQVQATFGGPSSSPADRTVSTLGQLTPDLVCPRPNTSESLLVMQTSSEGGGKKRNDDVSSTRDTCANTRSR
jgi:hypothetical protein